MSATFVRGAVRREDFPRDPVPQLALVGRSNVGKSTLINALTRLRVARTSAAPGKTREINLYLVTLEGFTPGRLYLADLPGYGYARGGEATSRDFDRLTQEYFSCPAVFGKTASERVDRYGPSAALLVVDARHPGLQPDLMAHLWLNSTTLPVVVIAAKIDKLNRAERTRALHAWEKHLNAEVIPVAATTGEGLAAVWKAIATSLAPPQTRRPAVDPPSTMGPLDPQAMPPPMGPTAPPEAGRPTDAAPRTAKVLHKDKGDRTTRATTGGRRVP